MENNKEIKIATTQVNDKRQSFHLADKKEHGPVYWQVSFLNLANVMKVSEDVFNQLEFGQEYDLILVPATSEPKVDSRLFQK